MTLSSISTNTLYPEQHWDSYWGDILSWTRLTGRLCSRLRLPGGRATSAIRPLIRPICDRPGCLSGVRTLTTRQISLSWGTIVSTSSIIRLVPSPGILPQVPNSSTIYSTQPSSPLAIRPRLDYAWYVAAKRPNRSHRKLKL